MTYRPLFILCLVSTATYADTLYCVHDDQRNDSQFCFGAPPAPLHPLGPLYRDCDIEALDLDQQSGELYAASGKQTPRKGHLYHVHKRTAAITDLGDIVEAGTGKDVKEVDALSFHPLTGELWGWAQDKGLFKIPALPEFPTPIEPVVDAANPQCLKPTSEVPTIAAQIVIPQPMEVEDITWNWSGTALYALENVHTDDADSHGDNENQWSKPDFNADFDTGIRLWAYDSTSNVIREICDNLLPLMGEGAEIEGLEALPKSLFQYQLPVDALLVSFHGPKKSLYTTIALPPLPLPAPPAPVTPCQIVWEDEFSSSPFNDIEGLAYQPSYLAKVDSKGLRKAVTAKNINKHLQALQKIADTNNQKLQKLQKGLEASQAKWQNKLQKLVGDLQKVQQQLAEALQKNQSGKIETLLQRVKTLQEEQQKITATLQEIKQQFARTQMMGNRVAGSAGYDASAEYVKNQLQKAGYQVSTQEFEFPFFYENSPPLVEQVTPNVKIYPPNDPNGIITMAYSGSGDFQAIVQAVDVKIPPGDTPNTSTSGCEAADFANFGSGRIALLQRGTCPFALKVWNAQQAGAKGVIIFNEGQKGRTEAFLGTLQEPVFTIPVVATSFAIGEELDQLGEVRVHMNLDVISEILKTSNVLAETVGGNEEQVVMVGAHLDSAPEGPGINDNGSGVATILEIALQMAKLPPVNKVRWAFWSAEEMGLIGSGYYVGQLTTEEVSKVAFYLNFDMIASPNYVRFVYDGDGSHGAPFGPPGSAEIEQVFTEYFANQKLATDPTIFDGRSDYQPFLDVGIPIGGLFTGADELKTAEQAIRYGGTPGAPLDAYYHTPKDDLNNVELVVLEQMADGSAHAMLTLAMTKSLTKKIAPTMPTTFSLEKEGVTSVATSDFKGPYLQR